MNNNSGLNTRLAVCIVILIVTCTLILDRLVPEGIFLDGVTYAAISRNLAIGKGSFWHLYYRGDWGFYEHPPLMFGLQAIFFKVLGDHYLTEKIYSFVIWVLTAIAMRSLWKRALAAHYEEYSYALPLLLWCLAPTITWGYTNNILDCTMALFDIAAVLFIYRAIVSGSRWQLIVGAVCIFAALLTKGPVGMFPLAVPGLYWLAYKWGAWKELGRAVVQTLVLVELVVVGVFLLFQFPESRSGIEQYLHQQLMAALGGEREITGGGLGRWTLIYELLMQMLVPIALGVIVVVLAKVFKAKRPEYKLKNTALFFLLVGIAASLPMMLSVKQRTFYLVPSLPYYIMALCVVLYPFYIALTNRLGVGEKRLKYFKMSAAVISLGLCVYLGSKVGQPGRDHEMIANMKYIGAHMPKGEKIGICSEMDKDYSFLAYIQRYNRMEVNPVFYAANYVLIDKQVCNNDMIPFISIIGFKKQEFGIERYELYKRQFPLHFDFTLLNPVFRTRGK
ncbi:MAG TPA: glycosyltransferase family 39 protein [Flavipsychrobacter sp.]